MKVFISYSHKDKKYVDANNSYSILAFIEGLKNEINVEFWHDGRISTGDLWDDKIRENINASNMAICLVSQSFIDSKYITNVEIYEFLKKRKEKGMIIYPIILSACDWNKCEWLKKTKYTPPDNKNIERDYSISGKRKELYASIREEIKNILLNMNNP